MKYVRRCGCRNVTEITDGQCITAAVCGNTDKDRKVSCAYESKEDDFGQKNRYRLFLSYMKLRFHTIKKLYEDDLAKFYKKTLDF